MRRYTGEKDEEFCPFPSDTGEEPREADNSSHLGDTVLVIPFVKSPLTVSPSTYSSLQYFKVLSLHHRTIAPLPYCTIAPGEPGDVGLGPALPAGRGQDLPQQLGGQDRWPHLSPATRHLPHATHHLIPGDRTGPAPSTLHSSATKQWTIVPIPHAYIASSWPIRLVLVLWTPPSLVPRYTACDPGGGWVAVAGRTGLAHYSAGNKR